MTHKLTLTKRAIDAIPTPTKEQCGSVGFVPYWDDEIAGFCLRVRANGTKTFALVYRNRAGRSRCLTLGKYGALTADAARKAAKQEHAKIALGDDPAASRDELRGTLTLKEVMDLYIERHLSQPDMSRESERSCRRVREQIATNIGRKLVSDITDVDMRNLLNSYRTQKGCYNSIRSYISSCWTWGRQNGPGGAQRYIARQYPNPTDGIEPMKSTSRATRLTLEQYRKLFDAIDTMMLEQRNDPARLLAAAWCAWSGCRPIESVRLRHEHINLELGTVELHEHKNYRRTGQPKVFFLTKPLREIIVRAQKLRDARKDDSPFIFPRRGNQKASGWLAKTWQSIVKRSGVRVTLQQLRSAYINSLDDAGLSREEVAGVTQHFSLQTLERHYRLLDLKRAGANAERHAALMLAQTKRGSAHAAVVSMGDAA